jgi:hypothetical protein
VNYLVEFPYCINLVDLFRVRVEVLSSLVLDLGLPSRRFSDARLSILNTQTYADPISNRCSTPNPPSFARPSSVELAFDPNGETQATSVCNLNTSFIFRRGKHVSFVLDPVRILCLICYFTGKRPQRPECSSPPRPSTRRRRSSSGSGYGSRRREAHLS